MSQGLLVVNADDFGLTPGVCEGILRAHESGAVSSTSALVVAPAFGPNASALRDSGLPTGLHVALVGEDPLILGPGEVPTLYRDDGTPYPTWRKFVARAACGAVDGADLRKELSAQMEVLRSAGVTATHVDGHQNLHIWPTVAKETCVLAAESEIGAVRLPGSNRLWPTALGVRALASRARRRFATHGIHSADQSAGLDGAGTMDGTRIRREIAHMAGRGRLCDLTVHPGMRDDPDRSRYRWGYSWDRELAALCAAELPAWIDRLGLRLVSYADASTLGPQE